QKYKSDDEISYHPEEEEKEEEVSEFGSESEKHKEKEEQHCNGNEEKFTDSDAKGVFVFERVKKESAFVPKECYECWNVENSTKDRTTSNVVQEQLKRQALEEIMSEIDDTIQHAVQCSDQHVLNDIVNYCCDALTDSKEEKTPLHYLWNLRQHIIPTAVVFYVYFF
ncbi:hypothetical protein RFI_05585, partial [Reticulomyxa filosa]